jgi:zinc protease
MTHFRPISPWRGVSLLVRAVLALTLIGGAATVLPLHAIAQPQAAPAQPTAPAATQPAQAQLPPLDSVLPVDPAITIGKLQNGLTYYIRRNPRPERRVQLRLVVKTGSVFEADDQRGLAHMLEHMAFNGTAHFKPGELVSYFESAGARFGPHVNAYTSFDETVYMLQVATDKPGLVDKGLLALADFAGAMTLDPAEIDKERGVVIEEWRLRQGAGTRILEKQAPVLFYKSRYAQRIPIGTPEILRTFTPARLRDFYETWYRPERMAVVVVGDVDPKAMVTTLSSTFGSLAAKRPAAADPDRSVPAHTETLVNVASDAEAQSSTVNVLRKVTKQPQDRVADYRRDLVERLMFQLLNLRLAEISRRGDAPFLGAGGGQSELAEFTTAVSLGARVEDGKIADGLRAIILEARRARELGFTAPELDRARRSLSAAYEQALAEKDKTESSDYAAEYIRNFLNGEPIPGIQLEYTITTGLLPGVTLDEVSAAARALLQDDSRVVLATAPEKAAVTLPDEARIRQVIADAVKAPLEPWQETATRTELMKTPPTAGKVTASRRIEPLNVTVLTLSNGVEVWLKPTDFKNDQVLLGAYARGGASTAPPAEFFNTVLSASLVSLAGVGGMSPTDLGKVLAGRIASVSPFVELMTHGIRGSARPQDLETALQLAYLTFTEPGGDPNTLELMKRQLGSLVANRAQNPNAVFSDRLRALNTGNHYAFKPFTSEVVAGLKLDTLQQAYKTRFSNAADFTFFIVGTFDVATVTPLIERYVASLPSSGRRSSHERPLGLQFPAAIEKTQVEKGREPKSETVITFFADAGADPQQAFLADAAASVLEMRLRDRLREALGSTYSVSASYSNMLPQPGYGTVTIDFGSAPDRAASLTSEVLTEVKRLRMGGPTAAECAKVREQERQDFETALKQNGFWLSSLQTAHLLRRPPTSVIERPRLIARATPSELKLAFRRYFPPSRYTIATLMPEAAPGGRPTPSTAPAPPPPR